MEQIYIPKQDYKVLVCCFTYNQSKYIEDALNGFAMQQTEFPFVCLVMDDCSTDGEQEVIKAWMDRECDMEKAEYIEIELSNIILVPHKTNVNCMFAFFLLKQNLYGTGKKTPLVTPWREHCEYEAICEGDDYWIDPHKLQKQVDLMDANPTMSFCHTGFDCLHDEVNRLETGDNIIQQNVRIQESGENLMEAILDGNRYRIQTVTTLVRISNFDEANKVLSEIKGKFLMGDTQKWVALLSIGTAGFLSDKTSVYRLNEGSACRQRDMKKKLRFDLSCAEMRIVMAEVFNLRRSLQEKLQKEYQHKLNLYLCCDSQYKPFVALRFSGLADKLQFYLLKTVLGRFILKKLYFDIV